MRIDARIPVRFAPQETRAPDEALLLDRLAPPAPATAIFDSTPTDHPPGCDCCLPRSAAAQAMAALFHERAKGQGPAFRSLLAAVTPAGEAEIRAALNTDPLVSGRYRLA